MTPGMVIFFVGGGQTSMCVCTCMCVCVYACACMCVCVCVCILHIVMLEPVLLCMLGVNFCQNAGSILCLKIHYVLYCVCSALWAAGVALYKFPLSPLLYYCPAPYIQFVTEYM